MAIHGLYYPDVYKGTIIQLFENFLNNLAVSSVINDKLMNVWRKLNLYWKNASQVSQYSSCPPKSGFSSKDRSWLLNAYSMGFCSILCLWYLYFFLSEKFNVKVLEKLNFNTCICSCVYGIYRNEIRAKFYHEI